jgi:hypothetical protein
MANNNGIETVWRLWIAIADEYSLLKVNIYCYSAATRGHCPSRLKK